MAVTPTMVGIAMAKTLNQARCDLDRAERGDSGLVSFSGIAATGREFARSSSQPQYFGQLGDLRSAPRGIFTVQLGVGTRFRRRGFGVVCLVDRDEQEFSYERRTRNC